MAKNRDWVDYANVTANVVQTAQLDGINTKMRQMAELELQKEYREQQEAAVQRHEDILRDAVFVYSEQLRDLEEVASQNPVAAYIRASHLKGLYANLPQFKASGFRKFEDKERLANVQRTCDRLIHDSAARLNPDDHEKCDRCVQHIFSRNDLIQLITTEEQREQLASSRESLSAEQAAKQTELEDAKAQQRQHKKPLSLRVSEGVIAVGSTAFVVTILGGILFFLVGDEGTVERFERESFGAWMFLLVGSMAVVGVVFYLTQDCPYTHRRDELIKKVAALELVLAGMTHAVIRREAEINQHESLYTKFGTANLEDYRTMLRERDLLLSRMLGDFVKSFVGRSQTSTTSAPSDVET